MRSNPPKYKETKWQEQEITDMKASLASDEPLTSGYAVLQDGQEIKSNFSFLPPAQREKMNLKYFLLDNEDARWINNIMKRKANGRAYLSSLKSFSSDRSKKLYIRTMPSTIQNSGKIQKTKKVFTDDVLELIPIALKQQKTPIYASDDRLEKYRQKWKSTNEHMYNSIDINEFKEVLEEFDINKTQITIVPDVVYRLTSNEIPKHPENIAETFSPDGKMVIEPAQAAFIIFHCVCGYNWKVKYCNKHPKCLDFFMRDYVVAAIKEFAEMNQKLFVTVDYVRNIIEKLAKSICQSPEGDRSRYNALLKIDSNEKLHVYDYYQVTESHGLVRFTNYLINPMDNALPVWIAKMFFIAGWIQQFLVVETKEMITFLATSLVSRCPKGALYEMHVTPFMESIIICESKESDDSEESEELSDEESTSDESLDTAGENEEEKSRRNIERAKRDIQREFNKNFKEEFKVELKAWKKDQKKRIALLENKKFFNPFVGKNKSAPIESSSEVPMPIEKKMNELKIESNSKNLPLDMNSTFEKEITTKEESLSGSKDSGSKGHKLDALNMTTNFKKENKLEKRIPKEQFATGSTSTSTQMKSSLQESLEENKNDLKTESKCCPKCLRTSEMCNEAKKELKTTQNKLAKLEKKSKHFDELEKKMKEKDKEIEDKNLENEQLKRQVQEMEKMKSRLAQYESMDKQLNETDEKVTEPRDNLQKKVAQLEAQLKSKEQNSEMSQLKREIAEKDEEIALLQETNMRVTVRNEEQAKNIQNLLDRLMKCNSNGAQ